MKEISLNVTCSIWIQYISRLYVLLRLLRICMRFSTLYILFIGGLNLDLTLHAKQKTANEHVARIRETATKHVETTQETIWSKLA